MVRLSKLEDFLNDEQKLQEVFSALDTQGQEQLGMAISYRYGLKNLPLGGRESHDQFKNRESNMIEIDTGDWTMDYQKTKMANEPIQIAPDTKKWAVAYQESKNQLIYTHHLAFYLSAVVGREEREKEYLQWITQLEPAMVSKERTGCRVCGADHRTLACNQLRDFPKLGDQAQQALIQELSIIENYKRDENGLPTELQEVFNALDPSGTHSYSVGIQRLTQEIAYRYGLKNRPMEQETWEEFIKREGNIVSIKNPDVPGGVEDIKIDNIPMQYNDQFKRWDLVTNVPRRDRDTGKMMQARLHTSIDTFVKSMTRKG